MHVAFLSSSFPRAPGASTYEFLLRRAVELGRLAAVTAITPTPWAPRVIARQRDHWAAYVQTPSRLVLDGVTTHYPRYVQIPGRPFHELGAASMAVGTLPLLRRLHRAQPFDVLFAQALFPEGVAAVLLGRWIGVPAVCLGRGTDVVQGAASSARRRLAAWTVRGSAGMAVVARGLARVLREYVPAAAPAVIYNGVDLERFAPADRGEARARLGLDADRRVALYVGRLARGKGLAILVDAFASVRRELPDARLVLVGDGPLRGALQARAADIGLSDTVRFAGEQAHADVPSWINAADVVVLPSESEGFPNVVREALACGRPVVATPVGDVPSVVGPETGALVPVGDAGALARALVRSLTAPWSPERLRDHVRDMTWARNAAETLAFLQRAIAVDGRGDA